MAGKMIRRFVLWTIIGIAVGALINELSFAYMKSEAGRGPQRIEITIPAGTAEKVANGEGTPSIPQNMVFVTGDILVVNNQDVVDHRLGELFIPSMSSASLSMNDANNFSYQCSFQPTKTFGLDVREPVTFSTRLYGILIAGVPLGLMGAIYSLVIRPLEPNKKVLV